MEKYRIERGSVQETLLIPLYGRVLCTRRFPFLFSDVKAEELLAQVDYDFSGLDAISGRWMYVFGALEVAMRQKDIEWEVRNYLEMHPKAAVVNLGCGLDDTGRRCDNGQCRIFNIDLPDVIALRDRLLPPKNREVNVAFDIKDTSWFEILDSCRKDGVVFFAAGVFYYFGMKEVEALVRAMAGRFSGGILVFDAVGPFALHLMTGTWLRKTATKNADALFALKDAENDIARWSEMISVSSRGYMQGYAKLEGPGIRRIYRLLARIADGPMHLRIVRIAFQ